LLICEKFAGFESGQAAGIGIGLGVAGPGDGTTIFPQVASVDQVCIQSLLAKPDMVVVTPSTAVMRDAKPQAAFWIDSLFSRQLVRSRLLGAGTAD